METKVKYSLALALCLLVFSACKKTYSPLEYKQWIESEESGLHKTKIIGNMEYGIQYQTREYLLLLHEGPDGFKNELNIEEAVNDFSEDVQIVFSIRNLDGIPPLNYQLMNDEEYYARLQHLNGPITEDFFLVTPSDTIPCAFAHLERDFGIGPELKLSLAFNAQNPNYDFEFCYNDRLFNNGMVKFTLLQENLNDLPELRSN